MAYVFLSMDGFDKEVCKRIDQKLKKLKHKEHQEKHREKWMGVLFELKRFNPDLGLIKVQFQYDELGDGRLNHGLDVDRASAWCMVYGIEHGLDFAMDISNLDEVANDIIEYDASPKWCETRDGVRVDYRLDYHGSLMMYTYAYPDRDILAEVEKIKNELLCLND
jgi:hypothetical protein